MNWAVSSDGVRIAWDAAGQARSGQPLVFLHEFAGNQASWSGQLAKFADRRPCITFSARGYPPSEVPSADRYSQELAVQDVRAVIEAAGLSVAHLIGASMGGYTALNAAASMPELILSVTIVGSGWGSDEGQRAQFVSESEDMAGALAARGWPALAESYASGPTRLQLADKRPDAWREFRDSLAEHSSLGSACTLLGVQCRRPALKELIPSLRASNVPILIMTGDEDDGCVDANLSLKRQLASAGWLVLPRTGHAVNLEEPEYFNTALEEFLLQVDTGRWSARRRGLDNFSSIGIDVLRRPDARASDRERALR